jgi:hypothetical protein
MLGLGDIWTEIGFILTILSVIFCIAYGLMRWR